ncbi:MAG TPA: ATP-dependent Clp protease ATP-binding subunit [Candidatus Wallbacteria bacterium]|nr:ATP-dependent Clp protease ATP-binding subunit [Candidatus Wallbacteria bacterium]
MYDFFTEETKKLLNTAEEEARSLHHSYIGTEHLLLAIAKNESFIAARVLKMFQIDYQTIIDEVTHIAEERPQQYHTSLDLTPLAKLVIRLAVEEAQALGQRFISPEHILLGLLKCEEGIAARVFSKLKINVVQVQKKIRPILLSHRSAAPASSRENINVSKTPMCDAYGVDLTQKAIQKKLDPVIGRENEISRVIHILSRRTKNNPCLIGDPGVGKTAIIEGLAIKIINNQVPETLADKRVLLLNFSSIIAGAKFRGEFEERLKTIIEEIKESSNIILFIDEIHTIVGTGSSEGSMDAANILKPVLARGELQVIGATTLDEYRKYIEKDTALERRFQTVFVAEPSIDETIQILHGLKDRYEMFHRVKISDKAIDSAAKFSARYITGRFLPDKAIDLIDEAGAYVRLQNLVAPPDIHEIETDLANVRLEEEQAISRQDYERAAKMHCRDLELQAKQKSIKSSWEAKKAQISETSVVNEDDVARVVARWTGIPIGTLTENEISRLLKLEDSLKHRVIGQEEAIGAISQAIRRARAGLSDPRRPYGSFIFLGLTGVGKTELAKALAEFIYGDDNAMIRVDMSEFQEKHAVSRLVGAPPGYVGYDEAGQLTERIRRRPYSVVLLDEIEKAHPDIFNILLQVLEDGRLTDSHGRVVDFKNTIIIMTSNVGAKEFTDVAKIGFIERTKNVEYEKLKNKILAELPKLFRPEFLNRIDDTIVFQPLTIANVKKICANLIDDLQKRLASRKIQLAVTDRAMDYLVSIGYDINYGARPLKRIIQKNLDNEIANRILTGEFKDELMLKIDSDDSKLLFEPVALETATTPEPVLNSAADKKSS